jgi:DNA-binding transcriptional LysR family regulator
LASRRRRELIVELAGIGGSTTAIRSAVATGVGPAALSSLAVAPELANGTLRAVRVTDLDLSRRLLAVWRAGRQLTGPAADLLAIAARTS